MDAIAKASEVKIRRATKKIEPKSQDINTEIPSYNLLRVL